MTNYISSFRINDVHPEDFNLYKHPESNWDETEIKEIKKNLSDPGLTAEHRIKFIESYLKDEHLIKHNIKGTLLDYAARHFRYNLFQSKKPRLNELSEKEQKEYSDSYNNFYKSIETEIDKIGILEYYKNNRDEFYPDKYTLKGNIKILECLYKHWNILKTKEIRENPGKKEPEKKKNVNQSLSVKMNFTGEKEELEKILSNVKGNFLNYTDIKDVINGKENLSLCGNNKDITSLAFFYTLAEMELITITRTNYQQILNTFPELDYQTLKNYNTDLDNPIKSKDINLIIADTNEKEIFLNRVNELKKILFPEKKIK